MLQWYLLCTLLLLCRFKVLLQVLLQVLNHLFCLQIITQVAKTKQASVEVCSFHVAKTAAGSQCACLKGSPCGNFPNISLHFFLITQLGQMALLSVPSSSDFHKSHQITQPAPAHPAVPQIVQAKVEGLVKHFPWSIGTRTRANQWSAEMYRVHFLPHSGL